MEDIELLKQLKKSMSSTCSFGDTVYFTLLISVPLTPTLTLDPQTPQYVQESLGNILNINDSR